MFSRLGLGSRLYRNRVYRTYYTQLSSTKSNSRYGIIVKTSAIVLGVGGSIYVLDRYFYSSLLTRSIRALYVLTWIAYAYTRPQQDYNQLHEIAAESLLNLLMTNKGLYIKIGQAIANQGSLFPPAYQKRFARLYDDAPIEPWSQVDKTLKKNLGPNYEQDHFISIDHNPIASASIAQVHKGILKNGQPVALKVQHHYIEKQLVVDLFIYRLMSRVYEKVFDLPMSFFTSYISKQLSTETDFINEMKNSEKLFELMQNESDLDIYIPQVFSQFTTKQILIAEWIDGVSLVDKQLLIDSGFDVNSMITKYLQLLGRQTFKYGFVHADPHPGNLKIRFKNNRQQLVLLDHGLYVTLDPKFKKEYAELWEYIFLLNNKGIETIARDWGINSVDLFASSVLLRPVNINGKIDEDRDISRFLKDFLSDESKFPLQLLFLGRNMRMMQNLNQSYGSPVNRINILTKELVNSLLYMKQTPFQYLQLLLIKVNLFFSSIFFNLVRFRQILLGDRYGGKGVGAEDYFEVYMKNTAKAMGVDWV